MSSLLVMLVLFAIPALGLLATIPLVIFCNEAGKSRREKLMRRQAELNAQAMNMHLHGHKATPPPIPGKRI